MSNPVLNYDAIMAKYLKMLGFLKGHRKHFTIGVTLLLFSSLFEGVQLSFMLPMIDRIFNNRQIVVPNKIPEFLQNWINFLNQTDTHTLFWMVPMGFLIVFTLKQIVQFISDYVMNDIAQSVMRDVRFRLFERIQTLSLDYFSKKRTGELVSRITNDVGAIENGISYGLTDLFKQPFLILILICSAFTFNAKGTLIVFLMLPLVAWPMILISRKLRKLGRGMQEKIADITSHLLETIVGARILKAFCTEKYEIQRFRQQNHAYYRMKMKSIFNLNLGGPITEIASAICGIGVYFVLGREVLENHLSFGVFSFSFTCIIMLTRPIKKLTNVSAILQQALVASDRIYEVLDTKPTVLEAQNPKNFETLNSSIKFDNVSFLYEQASGPVLQGIDLEIKKGQLVAIIGPTGSGKSTLVNLIPRFYDATDGRVLFDGHDVKEASFKSLRSQIGIVTQEAILFNDTVRNNIAYGTFDATAEQIVQAAQNAFAQGFIERMPNGYDTMIGDRGFRLSGGEKQRLTIARALLKNPPILILDEATSQLDSESEKYVQQALDQLMQGRTVIAIAHRLSTILKADKIVVIEAGKIVGTGRHDELLFTCSLYRRLYETQFHTE